MAYKPGDIYLGLKGREMELPALGRKVTPQEQEILREEETIDGTLVSDLVGVRRGWTIEYELQTGPDFDQLLDLYFLHTDLNLIEVDRSGRVSEYTVVIRPISRMRETVENDWLWSGIALELEAVKCSR